MADTKITALTALTAADPANDVIPIVDVSDTTMAASGTTKKISVNNILGASGTATLASATITGALTIGGATSFPASVINTSGGNPVFTPTAATLFLYSGSSFLSIRNQANTQEIFNLTPAGVYTFGDGIGGTRMTLNSTGLGIGGSAAYKLDVVGPVMRLINSAATADIFITDSGTTNGNVRLRGESNALKFITGGGVTATIDSSGNVGIGVTPSAWRTSVPFRALQIGYTGAVYALGATEQVNLSSNYLQDTGGNEVRIQAGFATRYQQSSGQHLWSIAASSTAGSGITFTQAMTLDASGYLLLGTTDTTFTSGAGYKFGPGATPSNGQVGASSSNGDLTLRVYSTGAAAYRFYVGFGGTVFATSATISAISDARLKENVQNLDVGLNEILALKPRKFDWKAGKGKDIKGDRGFIAQEFETVFPNLIDEWADPAPEGEAPYKSVRQDLIPVLVKAIQELTARVQTLETR